MSDIQAARLRIQSCIHPPPLWDDPAAARQIHPAVSFILFVTRYLYFHRHESRMDFFFPHLQTWISNESAAGHQHECELHTDQWITCFCFPSTTLYIIVVLARNLKYPWHTMHMTNKRNCKGSKGLYCFCVYLFFCHGVCFCRSTGTLSVTLTVVQTVLHLGQHDGTFVWRCRLTALTAVNVQFCMF